MRKSRWAVLVAVTLGSVVFLAVGSAAAPESAKKVGADPKEWDRVADRAIAYLRSTQADDGMQIQSSVGFVASQTRERVYVAIGAVAGVFSLVVGAVFVFGFDSVLPSLNSFLPF